MPISNILFLSELFYPHGGGAELATYMYSKLVSESGINVKVITNLYPGEKEKSEFGRLEIRRLPLLKIANTRKFAMLGNFSLGLSSFLRHCIRWADVVYIPMYWFSAIPWAKSRGKRVVIHLHNYLLTCPLSTLYNMHDGLICQVQKRFFCPMNCIFMHGKTMGRGFLETVMSTMVNSIGKNLMGRLASKSDALICVSKAQRQLIMQTCDKSFERKLHVIYNPLPNLSYVEMGGNDFGYFGGDNLLKGFLVVYRAMRILTRRAHRSGVKSHATKFQNASETTRDMLEKAGFVTYGKLDESQYEKVYRRIRSVIVPSIWHEPSGYVVAEALLKGRIVIASEIGGIPEITQGCEGVQLVPAGDHEQLAEKMLYVEGMDREQAVELGIKNRQNIMKRFSNEQAVQRFIKVLTEAS